MLVRRVAIGGGCKGGASDGDIGVAGVIGDDVVDEFVASDDCALCEPGLGVVRPLDACCCFAAFSMAEFRRIIIALVYGNIKLLFPAMKPS